MKRKVIKRLEAKRDRAQALLDLVEAAQTLAVRLEGYADHDQIHEACETVARVYRRLEELS